MKTISSIRRVTTPGSIRSTLKKRVNVSLIPPQLQRGPRPHIELPGMILPNWLGDFPHRQSLPSVGHTKDGGEENLRVFIVELSSSVRTWDRYCFHKIRQRFHHNTEQIVIVLRN
jgi:hypothetical protein